jgi:adenylate kinase family enzyme
MTRDDAYESISNNKPTVIYISGKTSTGKSTFGRKLREELGYHVIELEAVLLDIIKRHGFDEQNTFRRVLYDSGDLEEKRLFIEATDKVISDAITTGKPVVIEGAVANTETLRRILQPATGLYFLYFHPNEIEVYVRNLTSRFMESSEESYGGLPLKFWQLIDKEAFGLFCQTRELSESLKDSIRQYALASQKESLVRLNEFQQSFDSVNVVEIQ